MSPLPKLSAPFRPLLLGLVLTLAALAPLPSAAAESYYLINGEPPVLEVQQLMVILGLPPGAYYVDEVGDFGPLGEAPVMNVHSGGPALGTGSGAPPQPPAAGSAPAAEPPAVAVAPAAPNAAPPDTGAAAALVGARIFWVYSPSIFSSATGGASGYIHLCPNNVFHRSSEGSFSVGGDYDTEYGMNDSWAGGAHTARSSGRWSVQSAAGGAALLLQNADGSSQRFAADAVRQGRWQIGRTKYAVETGRATCP